MGPRLPQGGWPPSFGLGTPSYLCGFCPPPPTLQHLISTSHSSEGTLGFWKEISAPSTSHLQGPPLPCLPHSTLVGSFFWSILAHHLKD